MKLILIILTSEPTFSLALEAVEVLVSVHLPGGLEARPRPREVSLDVTGEAAELPSLGVGVASQARPQPQPRFKTKAVFEDH